MSAKGKILWISFFPWAILGSLVVLTPLMFLFGYGSITRERDNMSRLLVEKGTALIRSFEAGSRAGMMAMGWGGRQIQRLLVETGREPDILYLAVTDNNGTVVAHSNPDRIGEKIDRFLPPAPSADSRQVRWRRVLTKEGLPAFEVYRQFMPLQGERYGRGSVNSRSTWERDFSPDPANDSGAGACLAEKNWCEAYMNPRANRTGTIHYIFVGLDMGALEAASAEATRHTLVMSIAILLIGFAGMVSLLLAQGYKVAKRSLAKVQAFSDQAISKMPLGLIATDENGRVVVFNEAAGSILDKSALNMVGEDGAEVLPPEMWGITSRIDAGEEVLEEELDCSLGHNGALPLLVSAAALKGGGDLFLGYVFIFRDLSEVRRLKQEVERSRRLASVGSLAAGVAHEIRNPLSSIKGFATYFKERYRNHPQDRETAEVMIQEVERMDRVIGQLLEFARPSALNVRLHPLPDLIRHSLKLIQEDARAGKVEIRTQLPSDLPDIMMDPDKMAQVLLNLYLNALQAMSHGGIMEVRAAMDQGGSQIKIMVRDSGEGIDPAHKERVFDPYFTTKAGGTGLGLAIVHKIVEAHGGVIEIDSVKDQGTTVTVALPVRTSDHGHE
jgi:two-component system sensor histidine kinase HydH